MRPNISKRRLEADELVLCMAINQARTNDVPLIAATCGFHAVFVDMEHAAFSLETASLLCTSSAALGVTPLVRIGSKASEDIQILLDGGAQGLMIPHIDTAADAETVVGKIRFPPEGTRSICSTGPHVGYGAYSVGEITRHMNAEVLVIALLETPMAIGNADAIAAVPGVDVLHIGSRDLALEAGIEGGYKDPRMIEMYREVARAARKHGKATGLGGARGDTEFQAELYRMGFRFMTIGSDVGYMIAGGKADVRAATMAVEGMRKG